MNFWIAHADQILHTAAARALGFKRSEGQPPLWSQGGRAQQLHKGSVSANEEAIRQYTRAVDRALSLMQDTSRSDVQQLLLQDHLLVGHRKPGSGAPLATLRQREHLRMPYFSWAF